MIKNYTTYIMILLSAVTMLIGCYTPKKANRQVIKAQIEYPNIVAQHCSSRYPPVESVRDSIVIKDGETIYNYDTVVIDCDSVVKYKTDTKVKYIQVTKTRVDTFYKTNRVVMVNKAQVKLLSNSLEEVRAENNKLSAQRKILIIVCLILGIYTIGRWVLRYWNIKLP